MVHYTTFTNLRVTGDFDADNAFNASTLPVTATGSTTARTLANRFADALSVKDFGATGDGVTNDAAAFVAALATGKSVFVPSGTYVLTSGLTMQTRGQRFMMDPAAKLLPSGSFDMITLTGSKEHMGISGLYVQAAGMTGGNIIKVTSASRVELNDILVGDPWNFLYVEASNVCRLSRTWVNNCRGTYGIQWYGDNSTRSDVLNLTSVTLSGNTTARPTGVLWDGNCDTLQVQGLILVNCGYGVQVKNTSGGTAPAFGLFDDLEIDFPSLDAVRLEAGSHYLFTPSLYLHGSVAGSGVYVGASVTTDTVTLSGGKVTSHARYGVENAVTVKAVNLTMSSNALADFSGTVHTTSPKFEVDTNFHTALSGAAPTLTMDSGDFLNYDRSNNFFAFTIGSTSKLTVSSTRTSFTTPARLASYTVATVPNAGTSGSGAMIYISDMAGGAEPAFSDGTNWRRCTDRTVAS